MLSITSVLPCAMMRALLSAWPRKCMKVPMSITTTESSPSATRFRVPITFSWTSSGKSSAVDSYVLSKNAETPEDFSCFRVGCNPANTYSFGDAGFRQ